MVKVRVRLIWLFYVYLLNLQLIADKPRSNSPQVQIKNGFLEVYLER